MPLHLVADISSHGYGHLAQTAPILNALRLRLPDLRLTVRCALPLEVLARRIAGSFDHLAESLDVGMLMQDAVTVRVEESAAAHRAFHAGWEARVAREAAALARLDPDLVLANVPYLSLAAAARAGIPAVGCCSLNWADIFSGCCGSAPDAAEIEAQMRAAYRSAVAFLRPEPGMPMADLGNVRPVGPIANPGRRRRAEVAARLGVAPGERIAPIALGGIPTVVPIDRWPDTPGWRWIVPPDWPRHPRASSWDALCMPWADIVASSDALIAKPGYGAFAEAACNALPVLTLRRPGWPEEPCLVEWLKGVVPCADLARDELDAGRVAGALEALVAAPRRVPVAGTGADEAADLLAAMVG